MSRIEALRKSLGFEKASLLNQNQLKKDRETKQRKQKPKVVEKRGRFEFIAPATADDIRQRVEFQILRALSHVQDRSFSTVEIKYLNKHQDLIPQELSHVCIPELKKL